MLMMLVRLGTGRADAHDAGPPFVLSQKFGQLMLVRLGQAQLMPMMLDHLSFYRKSRAGDAGDRGS